MRITSDDCMGSLVERGYYVNLNGCLSYPDPWLVKKPAFLARESEPKNG